MIDDDLLDARLRAADRGRAAHRVSAAHFDVTAQALVARAHRKRWAAPALLAGLLLVPLAAMPATAMLRDFEAQTGNFCSGTECGASADPADLEFIDVDAPDFEAWLELQAPEQIVLPSGVDRTQIDVQVREIHSRVDGSIVAHDVEFAYAQRSWCAWVDEWMRADDDGALQARVEASAQLAVVASASIWTGADGGGLVPWVERHLRSAQEGSRDGMQFAAEQGMCSSWDGADRSAWVELHAPQWWVGGAGADE